MPASPSTNNAEPSPFPARASTASSTASSGRRPTNTGDETLRTTMVDTLTQTRAGIHRGPQTSTVDGPRPPQVSHWRALMRLARGRAVAGDQPGQPVRLAELQAVSVGQGQDFAQLRGRNPIWPSVTMEYSSSRV